MNIPPLFPTADLPRIPIREATMPLCILIIKETGVRLDLFTEIAGHLKEWRDRGFDLSATACQAASNYSTVLACRAKAYPASEFSRYLKQASRPLQHASQIERESFCLYGLVRILGQPKMPRSPPFI